MTARPLVSIVTPSFNQARYLESTIRSVLDQDYQPIEYIVVDGGSTDGSVDLIRKYDGQIAWWTSAPDRGQADALNKGFARAHGQYLGWLCSDDTLLPSAVTRFVQALERDSTFVLAYGDAIYTDEASQRIGYAKARPWDLRQMARGGSQHVHQPSSLWPTRAWRLAGPLDDRLDFLFDTAFYLRLAALGPATRLEEPLATYRVHSGSKTAVDSREKAEETVRFGDAFFGADSLPDMLRPHSRAGRASFYRRGALELFNLGEIRQARRVFLRSLVVAPRISRRTARHLLPTLLPAFVVRFRRARRSNASLPRA
jgi:glycosyltransferase involved in cell wall biosynthesis